jgi:anti-anti-sigma factor
MKKFGLKQEEREGGVKVVYLTGYLDSSTSPEFQECLAALLEEGKVKIIADMSELEYIAAAGLGTIMGEFNEARNGGGDLILCGMSPKIRNLFDMLGFSRLLTIYGDQEEAARKFKEETKDRTFVSVKRGDDAY